MSYKRITNKDINEYNPEIDFCANCKYYTENGCTRRDGACDNYERFIEIYNQLMELENKIENKELQFKIKDSEEVSTHRDWLIRELQKKNLDIDSSLYYFIFGQLAKKIVHSVKGPDAFEKWLNGIEIKNNIQF